MVDWELLNGEGDVSHVQRTRTQQRISCARWTVPVCSTTCPPASLTASASAWVLRCVTYPTQCDFLASLLRCHVRVRFLCTCLIGTWPASVYWQLLTDRAACLPSQCFFCWVLHP